MCCSLSGVCTVQITNLCTHIWSPSATTCTPTSCAQLGACCIGVACVTTLPTGCPGGDGRSYHGVGTLCGPPSNRIACCPANFNQINGVEITDLYSFFSAWFAGAPTADFDHDNAITVTDFMRFINAWSAGCP